MAQEYPQQYYMVVDEKSTGPYTLDEVTLHPSLTPETLVWKPGLDNWVAAKTLPELIPAFSPKESPFEAVPPEYTGPQANPNPNPDPDPYESRPHGHPYEDQHKHSHPFGDNPQYQEGHTYHNQDRFYDRYDRYRNGYRPGMRTNWLPWAIVATIVGFFASCIGAIFGIIGIVQANKANRLYMMGYDREGDAANSNARLMTIIGLIFAGIGIIIAWSFGSFFGNFTNLSYL
ncbi:MAG: DUF4339 domain-containing protein [Muribaculaceae bacterium]|nr:DUF4339 domain-containing protein [Muribaculaceae bacterium]